MLRSVSMILAAVIILSCSSVQLQEKVSLPHKLETTMLPRWVYKLPPGTDYVIGIAPRSLDTGMMQESAREMAAIMYSRNHGSYTIDNTAITTREDPVRSGSAFFRLNVGSPDKAREYFNKLQLIDEAYSYEYYLGLFSLNGTKPDNYYKEKLVPNFPDWFNEREIADQDGVIKTCAQDRSYDLVIAWDRAAENARFELAKYLERQVQAAVISRDEEIDKRIAVESNRKLVNMKITRGYIVTESHDNLLSYIVYLEMEMQK